MSSKLGLLGRLTKKLENREYFSTLPVGTLFIVIDEIETPAYDLTGLFIMTKPKRITFDKYHFSGYINKGSYEILGKVEDCVEFLKQANDINFVK